MHVGKVAEGAHRPKTVQGKGGGTTPYIFRPVPTPSRTLPQDIQGRYTEGEHTLEGYERKAYLHTPYTLLRRVGGLGLYD